MNNPRYVFVALATAGTIVAAVACGPQSKAPEPSKHATRTATTSSVAPQPLRTVSSLFDPEWMGIVPAQPNGWQELNRTITEDFQQFDFRPVDETEHRRRCNGCARWTATLTAYSPGKFDPTDTRTGQPVAVNGSNDGFFRPTDDADDTKDATLTWQYADNAWATAVGLTSATRGLDELIGLAHALSPAERTPIRLPMTFANLPANMPLAEINIDTSPLEDEANDYGTTLTFAPCGSSENGAIPDCLVHTDRMDAHIWPDDYRTPTGGMEQKTVPLKVGGRDGLYNEATFEAVVQVAPGMHVEFGLSGPSFPDNGAGFEKILADVSWARDPAYETTWPPVSDWVK
ncbi:MAG: hypothetical protein QOD39_5400 [Mycobacterium sp.]|jgi:hypothetical protein|nr:hypothetical protein [Mycobacterium sp.]